MSRTCACVVCVLGCLAVLGAMPATARAVLVLHDSFDYPNVATLTAGGWQSGNMGVTGSTGTPAVSNTYFFAGSGSNWISTDPNLQPPVQLNQTTMRLGNAIMFRELGVTLTEDFTITANVAIAGYSRSLQIGLADSTGAGYSLQWNASQPTSHSGNGAFVLFAQAGWPVITPNEGTVPGTAQLSVATSTRTPPTSYVLPTPVPPSPGPLLYSPSDQFLGYTEIKLVWSAAAGTLQAFQDNSQLTDETPVVTGPDAGLYSSFTRLYVGGGTSVFIDSVKVETNQAVTPPFVVGDFNHDGDVNGRDFLSWQRGNSPSPLSSGDLGIWQDNFGTTSGSATGAGVSVPEPGASVMLLAMAGWMGVAGRIARSDSWSRRR